MALLVHKISYDKRDLVPIFIRRHGFAFDHISGAERCGAGGALTDEASDAKSTALAERLCEFLTRKLTGPHPERFTERGLRPYVGDLGMTRDEMERAVAVAKSQGLLTDAPVPAEERYGNRRTYLQPTTTEQPL
ncbi:MAG TPA: hypothetical protein VMT66_16895 [Steroidobacteraceae bacterium]|nr:hypothetical protein [Steroidobacteraceae bacterium]